MYTNIYPCIWFNEGAQEVAAFYTQVFPNSRYLSERDPVIEIDLHGTRFMLLQGGPAFSPNAAVSYFVYCGSEEEIDRLYAELSEGGSVLMPLDSYDWTSRYAWVQDKFGVNWQLDIDDIRSDQKIVPALLFSNEKKLAVKEARDFYTGIFDPSRLLMETPYPPGHDMPGGTLLFAQFRIRDVIFNFLSNPMPAEFDFCPGNSFVLECKDQQELDKYWEELGKEGAYSQCGWLEDKYGLSWQVIPSELPSLLSDPDRAAEVMERLLKMQKLEIAELKNT
ncbi:VOC family protein [Zeaxanthinibacter enoshimensis]|uniref:VOC family protein n=1 Tax=Zeaxanthinibacter enoshimensis TaxID=392009 RepID=UPI00356399EA